MRPIITICARAGSKGLPGKNTKEFNGKPLIAWTIEQALDWGAGPVVISSDDPAVKDIFGEYIHRETYFDERPADLAQDDTPKIAVLRHIIFKWLVNTEGKLPSYIVDLDPTNPCRTVADLEKCRKLFEENRYKTLISVTDAKKNPFMNQFLMRNGAPSIPCELPTIVTCRQHAPAVWDVNSNIYFYNVKRLQADKSNSPLTDKTGIYKMPDYAFCDIDNQVDFEVAELLHRKYYLNGRSEE